jgi:hypothetical protein
MAGKTPAISDKLKMIVKGALSTEANRIKITGVIPSGPGSVRQNSYVVGKIRREPNVANKAHAQTN